MDPYRELGIGPEASDEEIKSAYRKLAKQYHPDSNPQDELAAEKMNRINRAYAMLREGGGYPDLELDEDWYREQAEEASHKTGIFYNPVFRRVIVIGIAVCMAAVGIVSSFYSALWADTLESAVAEPGTTEPAMTETDAAEDGAMEVERGLSGTPGSEAAVSDALIETEEMEEMKTIYLAGGCFWGTQKFFDQFDGVVSTEVGYANGPDRQPTYEDVCRNSGHAETVRVDYDENVISLTQLLEYYFMVIDPTSVNRQGNDIGGQYRTGIYYTDDSQVDEIQAEYDRQEKAVGAKLAVEVLPIENFFPAEEYHQKYLDKNPGGYCHIPGKYFTLQDEAQGEG